MHVSIGFTVCIFLVLAHAHTDIVGVSQFGLASGWTSAIQIPDNGHTYRVLRSTSCRPNEVASKQQFWLKWRAPAAGAVLLIDAGTGIGSPNGKIEALRLDAFAFGPGLVGANRAWKVPIPTGAGYGPRTYQSLPGTSRIADCAFLKGSLGGGVTNGRSVRVINRVPRCVFDYNPGPPPSGYFPLLDYVFRAPRAATYYFLVYPRLSVASSFYVLVGSLSHEHNDGFVTGAGNGGVNTFLGVASTVCCGRCPPNSP